MIKIDDYIMDQERLDIYGECEIYSPDDFYEYFRHKKLVDEIYSQHSRLLSGVFKAIGEYSFKESVPAENQPMPDLTSTTEDPIDDDTPSPVHPDDEPWDDKGKIQKWQMAHISREDIVWGRRVIKSLSQVPYEAMVGLLGRTLMSTDPISSRYVGEGLFGALKHREKTGQPLSNYTCEMRFLKTGQPRAYAIDPHTLKPVPNMGAVLSPGRAAMVSKFAGKGAPCPNPHAGYLYDGKDDDGKVLFNGPGDSAGLQGSANMAKGVFLPYKALTNEIETAVGAPRYHYTTKEDPEDENSPTVQKPLNKLGKVGTSLATPVPGQPDSYTHYQDPKTGEWKPSMAPLARGYKATATVAGNRRKHDIEIPNEDGEGSHDLSYDVAAGGGAQTFDKQFRKWIQAQAEHPGWFDQRTAQYMQYRQQQAATSDPHYRDRDGNVIQRQRNDMPMVPADQHVAYTHAANTDAQGNVRPRDKKWRVPYDPKRRSVEPAVRVPVSPERQKAVRDHLLRAAGDPGYFKAQIDQYKAMGQPGLAAQWQQEFETKQADNTPKMIRLRQSIAASDEARGKPRAEKWDFGRGDDMVATGRRYPKGHKKGPRPSNPEGDEIFEPRRELQKDAKGKEFLKKTGQSHMLPMTRRVIPNLYSLKPALDESKPILISEALAQEITTAEQSKVPAHQVRLTQGDTGKSYPEICDEVIRQNYGTHRSSSTSKDGAEPKDVRAIRYTIGAKKGNRYHVHPVNEVYKDYPVCFTLADERGDVMFHYEQTKEDQAEQEQPILSPGMLNHMMGNNRTILGGHNAAPAGEPEKIPYESQYKTNKSLYGKQNPDGTWNTNQPLNAKKPLGWSTKIISAVTYGVDYYLNTSMNKVDEKIQERMKSPQVKNELLGNAILYCTNNLRNGKFLDVNEGTDTHFNLRYMHHQFPHLYAVMMQLDRLVTGKIEEVNPSDPPGKQEDTQLRNAAKEKLWKHGNIAPSKMTLTKFKNWLNNEDVIEALEGYPIYTRVKTNRLTRRDGNDYVYKGKYQNRFAYQKGEDGKTLEDPSNMALARKGWTGLMVSVPQLWQMINDARMWYCRWVGKDMVRKVVQSETAKKSRVNRGGVYADDAEVGIESATAASQMAARAEIALTSGKGYSRFRGVFHQLLAEKQAAPSMIREELNAAKSRFAANPGDMVAAVNCVQLAMRLGDSLLDLKAYHKIETQVQKMKSKGGLNPDLNEPWTDDNTMTYILKHLPEYIKEVEKHSISNPDSLDAAGDKMVKAKIETPDQIKEQAKREAGILPPTLKKIAENIGYRLATVEDEVTPRQRSEAVHFAFEIGMGRLVDMDDPMGEGEEIDHKLVAQIEAAVSYYAIDTFLGFMADKLYPPRTLTMLRTLSGQFSARQVLPYFTRVAKLVLSSHQTNGGHDDLNSVQ